MMQSGQAILDNWSREEKGAASRVVLFEAHGEIHMAVRALASLVSWDQTFKAYVISVQKLILMDRS